MESKWNPNRTEQNGIESNGMESNSTERRRNPEQDFEQIWMEYPEERRGVIQMAHDAFRHEITSEDDADTAMANLRLWKQSEQWNKDGGQYIPYLNNWLERGTWKCKPSKLVSGGQREPDEDEIRAIQRMLAEGNE